MTFWEGYEVMKNAKYVDVYERIMLRNLGYFILQKNNKKTVRIEKILPLPFDSNYVDINERQTVADFNEKWLEDYDKKMEEFEHRKEDMEQSIKQMKFKRIEAVNLFGLFKNN